MHDLASCAICAPVHTHMLTEGYVSSMNLSEILDQVSKQELHFKLTKSFDILMGWDNYNLCLGLYKEESKNTVIHKTVISFC